MSYQKEEGNVWYELQADDTHAFEFQRGVLVDSPALENAVGPFLLNSLVNTAHLKMIFQRAGLNAAAEYFEAHVASSENVRIGDFGEVIAGRLLEEEEHVSRPIEKLRYRESPDWPMKLTDVFCVRVEEDRFVGFVFGEDKAGTTPPRNSLGKDAYRQIHRDIEGDEPKILFFTLDRLLDNRDVRAYSQLDDAMHRIPPVPSALRLVFVFDSDSWREIVLDGLDDGIESEEIELADDFICYLLTRDDLREAIAGAYTEAQRTASNG